MGGSCKPPQATVPNLFSRTAVTMDAHHVSFLLQASGTLTCQAGEEGVEVILPPSCAFCLFLLTPKNPSTMPTRMITLTLTSHSFLQKFIWKWLTLANMTLWDPLSLFPQAKSEAGVLLLVFHSSFDLLARRDVRNLSQQEPLSERVICPETTVGYRACS